MGRFGIMAEKKQSLKLPIFLIVAPAAGVLLSIFLYAVVNFIFSGVTAEPSSTTGLGLSDGASIAQGVDASNNLYSETPVFVTIANVILYLLGLVSVLAFVPCLVFGIIILNRRRDRQATPIEQTKSRNWEDLE